VFYAKMAILDEHMQACERNILDPKIASYRKPMIFACQFEQNFCQYKCDALTLQLCNRWKVRKGS
jgi:hypothetical protein